MSSVTLDSLNICENLAHIDQMLADHDRKRQEIRMASWQVGATMLGGAAVFFAAGCLRQTHWGLNLATLLLILGPKKPVNEGF